MPESRIVLFDINASLPVHVNLSFWFLDFFLTVLSIKSIELIIAKDGIVNLFHKYCPGTLLLSGELSNPA